ncbi:hypothetical protein [Longimicrobium sp.]|uniref:helix-hairpin-helix domain-containing protein n=1 Tax=Longimicrobium sp. TaxID=2029185 RepID=UPI002C4C3055|nr:hypothetical protein [Longimicrobium sp.]HSU13901.1 hypothetical protein [Longimicrobium sp.]
MTDVAPPLLLFRRRSTLEQLVLDPALEIGAGGEAVVYHLPHDRSLVAKVYHDPAIERARKLGLMLANPPAMPRGTAIAWPADLLLGGRAFAGFVMPFAEGPRVFEFYNPVTRRAQAPGFHFGLLVRAGRNLAAAFDALHAAGYVVGDVNESNILVAPYDAAVTLVDADSFQVRDPDGAVFRSRVGKPEFTPPELQGVSFGEVDRAPEHDRFGLAVVLFLLLMEGTHPFAARMEPGADAAPVEDRIRDGRFPHARDDDDCHPPRLSPRFETLDAEIRGLFLRAFVDGHADPAARPSAAEWRDALEAAEARLAQCAANPLHRHAAGPEGCPWCERARLLGGRDPFPIGIPAAPPVRARRLPRPAAAARAASPSPSAPVVSPFGVRQAPAPFVPPAAPLPAVFGPRGLLNPAVIIPTALVMLLFGGTVTVLGLLGLLWSAYALTDARFRQFQWPTALTGLMMAILAATILSLPHGGSRAKPASPDYTQVVVPADEPAAGEPSPDAATEAELQGPPMGRSWEAYLLPDVRSESVAQARYGAIPPLPDDGDAPMPADDGGTRLREMADVPRPPQLSDDATVAQALAAFVRAGSATPPPVSSAADTVVLWVRIGENGRVPEGGWQVISSTSHAAMDAAAATVPYLRYLPAEDETGKVSVWAAQRMVIEP